MATTTDDVTASFVLSTGESIPLSSEQANRVALLLGDTDLTMRVARAIHRAECSKASSSDIIHRLDDEEVLSAYWEQAEAAIGCMPRVIPPIDTP